MKLYLYAQASDGDEPIATFDRTHKSLHPSLDEARAEIKKHSEDWAAIFEIDTDDMSIRYVTNR